MAEIKWIKIVTEFFDDDKIEIIESMPDADMILIIWVKLLTLAGKKNMNGYIFLTENIPYTDEMLSTIFKRPLNTIRLALDIFKKFNMINYNDDGILQISNWEKHQNIEGMDRIRELGALRQAKYMKRKKEKEKEEQKLLKTADVSMTINDETREDKIRKELDKKRKEKKRYLDVVLLTPDEYKKLVEALGKEVTEEYIKDLNLYIQSKGRRYKSHYATILTWNRKDIREGKIRKPTSIKEKVKNDNYDWDGAMNGK